ncbi:MAG: L,D-transpeptidase family protein [Rhizobiaceae bacterium]|nr:L,D-transpeptidase family protein [Rhizobiaceae bacterium]
MTLFSRRAAALPVFAAALCGSLPVGDASAQYLFERLFNEDRQQRQMEPAAPVAPPPAPKVAAPQYYTYKVDALVRVDFGAIAAVPARPSGGRAATHSVTLASAQPGPNVVTLSDAAPADPARDAFVAAISGLAGTELFAEKDIAEALVAYYRTSPGFIWSSGGAANHRAQAAQEVLGEAAKHGLVADDYAVAPLAGPEDAARFEMAMSARVLRYVRDATRGRIDPNRLSGYHDFAPKPVDYAHALEVLSDAFAVRTYLEGFHPQTPEYAALVKELASLRASQENAIVVDPKLVLKPGESSPDFPKILQLIQRDADSAFLAEHGPTIVLAGGSELYSDDLVPVIKAAQAARGLTADGVIGPRTVAAIAGDSKADRVSKVEVAMEQMRWLPQKLASRHVFINVPEFRATYVEDGADKLTMRTVVGTPRTQTFFFQDEIEYVEFHPYWGIPRSILVNKYLPKLYEDPSYLDRIGYEVTDGRGQRVSSSSIAWTSYGANIPFDVRQPPGPKNSLGEMKIMFPNKHAIYMHDTPEKHLFAKDSRAYSNGCVRLQDPRAMAAAVLGWSREQVEQRLKGEHGQVDLAAKVPVYVVYFTAWPKADGTVNYSPDVYGRDEFVLKAMARTAEVREPAA